MNTHVFLVVESLPGRVHGGNLVSRELTPEQKTSAKFAINIQFFSSVYSIIISMSDEENGSTEDICYYCGAVGHSHWSLNCPEKTGWKKRVPAQNEVLPFISTNYCLETYEYDNEIVIIHNVKGRLKQNINFLKEKLLLAVSSGNLVLPILEYGYFFTIWGRTAFSKIKE